MTDLKHNLEEIESKFEMFQVLNKHGEIVNEEYVPDLSDEELHFGMPMIW